MAVLDTNIFINSLFRGASAAIVEAWGAGAFRAAASPATYAEYSSVFARMPLVGAARRDAWLARLRDPAHSMQVTETPEVRACRDPSDDKFLACAAAARAMALVSSDRLVLELGEFAGVPILDPRRFLARLG